MRKILYYTVLCFLLFLAAPYTITSVLAHDSSSKKETGITSKIHEPIAIEDSFERYIVGVVAAEMPALYNSEALKAQAVASRTYALNFIERSGENDYTKIGQAYIDEAEMRERWGDNFNVYYGKIAEAVEKSAGEIMVYEGEPIVAVFHAFSAGKTENSEDVWKENLPYLKSVDSEFDQKAQNFEQRVEFSGNEFITLLREEFPDIVFDKGDIMDQIKVNEYTEAGYVKQITIGNKIMDGSVLRRIFGLRSTNFEISRELEKIVFAVKGYGHGAGMSQVGANYLAEEGYDYKQILKYYYSDIEFDTVANAKGE